MAVDNSDTFGTVKTEIDLYGDDDTFDQMNQDDVVIGEGDDEFKTDSLGHHESEMEEHAGGDLMEEHHEGDLEDELSGMQRRQSEADDLLYDAVITDRTSPGLGGGRHSRDENGDSTSASPRLAGAGFHSMITGSGTVSQAERKNSCYVGNLTWWTTDQDLIDAVTSIGLSDVIDVKFYENRANGQSKGFALASFNMESSVRVCMERLPSRQIHGQVPVVLPYTKQSLAQFEAASKKPGDRSESSQGSGTPVGMPTTPTARVAPTATGMKTNNNNSADKNAPTFLGVLRIGATGPKPPATPISMGGPSQMNQLAAAAAAAAAVARSTMSMPSGPPGMIFRGSQMAPGGIMAPGMQPPGAGPGYGRPPMGMGGPMSSMGMGPPPHHMLGRPPPPGMMQGGPPNSMMRGPPNASHYAGAPVMQAQPGGMPPPGVPPGSYVNPNFYPGIATNRPHQELSDAEFEEIMNRNRTVSSSAISRAVSDAAAGDYASAIETLVTALSLIRQSKVAHDDRCKVLIGSLQDTLHGIEAKSYGSVGGGGSSGGGGGGGSHHGSNSNSSRRTKDHGSGRGDRSRSRDRTSGSNKRRHRSRSRSRSRNRYEDEYESRRSRRY